MVRSVVAHEALHAHPELQPDLFLTLGSTLALPRAVFDRLIPARQGTGPARRGRTCPAARDGSTSPTPVTLWPFRLS